MRSIWNGSISFGLVNIPVKLYSAVEHQAIAMHMLHEKDFSPIRFRRVCEKEDEEVAWKEIVKGVEVKKGQYIVMSEKELESIRPEKTQRIDIVSFVAAEQVDPILLDGHYYAGPESEKDKAYALFREALKTTGKVAIGTFVMRTKEYVVAIRPHGAGLLVTTLNYAYEIRDVTNIDELKGTVKITKPELELATQLIEKITAPSFDISEFKDSFVEGLKDLVKKKLKGEKITVVREERPRTSEENLIAALKASL